MKSSHTLLNMCETVMNNTSLINEHVKDTERLEGYRIFVMEHTLYRPGKYGQIGKFLAGKFIFSFFLDQDIRNKCWQILPCWRVI